MAVLSKGQPSASALSEVTQRTLNLLPRSKRTGSPRAAPIPSSIAEALRAGQPVDDRDFDLLLPTELRIVSSQYWTPLAVAARAAEWFDALGVQRVVDIGSGAGKFCVAAALAGTASYVGLEHRLALVIAARALAETLAIADKVEFVHGTLVDLAELRADAYYLFNPFGENWYAVEEQLDAEVELSPERHARDVAAVERLLREAPLGTFVLTYNGFGGDVPEGYDELRVDETRSSPLRLWRRTAHGRQG